MLPRKELELIVVLVVVVVLLALLAPRTPAIAVFPERFRHSLNLPIHAKLKR
jgi:hypothetical protein